METCRTPHRAPVGPSAAPISTSNLAPAAGNPLQVALVKNLSELLFASRDLVRLSFTVVIRQCAGPDVLMCVECRQFQHDAECSVHEKWCKAGRVVAALGKLVDDTNLFSRHSMPERRVREENLDLPGQAEALLSMSAPAAESEGVRS